MLFFWILSKWGGEGRALPKFFVTFLWVHFWSIKGVHFLQNANNFNFKLFLRLIYISYYDVYIVFLVLKIDRPNLKSSILRLVYRRSTCNFIGAVWSAITNQVNCARARFSSCRGGHCRAKSKGSECGQHLELPLKTKLLQYLKRCHRHIRPRQWMLKLDGQHILTTTSTSASASTSTSTPS